jgi:hypothetical protein
MVNFRSKKTQTRQNAAVAGPHVVAGDVRLALGPNIPILLRAPRARRPASSGPATTPAPYSDVCSLEVPRERDVRRDRKSRATQCVMACGDQEYLHQCR